MVDLAASTADCCKLWPDDPALPADESRASFTGMRIFHRTTYLALLGFCLVATPLGVAETTPGNEEQVQSLKEALERLQLPGVKINLDEWSVDVDAVVALDQGLLELIACTKDTKEHESIIAVKAKPSHIHAALLLIGATPGNPAMRKIVGEGDEMRFIDLPPRGGMVDVYLVMDTPEGSKEVPINHFIQKGTDHFGFDHIEEKGDEKPKLYPTHSFMFTGSVLVEHDEESPRQYVADYSGNVISIVTFGDELLSTPEIHDDSNHALMWEVRSDDLPEVDSPVTLRIKPQRAAQPGQAQADED